MFIYDEIKPLQVRVPTIESQAQDIQLYDSDNLYPQRCEDAIKRSYTLRSVVNSVADFLNGEGFVDPYLAKLKVNEEGVTGETLNRILGKVTKTYSRYETVCLHVGYDANCRISSLVYIPFEFVRYGLPDTDSERDAVSIMKYCTNWEYSGKLRLRRQPKIISYNTFNNDPDQIQNEIDDAEGIENYRGQILYLTPDHFQYPVATFDPILDHAQTQDELGRFNLGYTQNGMLATLGVMHPGEFESKEEEKKFKNYFTDRKGARNANKTFAIQDKSGTRKIQDLLVSLQPTNLDRIFERTEKSAIAAIIENEGWPKALVGVDNESNSIFNNQTLIDAYTYANSKTRNRRKTITEVFSMLMSTWSKPYLSEAIIQEQQYISSGSPAVPATPPATKVKDGNPAPAPTAPVVAPEQAKVNENLKNLSPKQLQALLRVRRMFRKLPDDPNHIDEAMAVDMLMQSLGIDNATAKMYLGIADEEDEIVTLYLKLKN